MCGCNKKRAIAAPAPAPIRRPVVALPSADTSVWGAHLWKVLHFAARSAPGREKAFAHILETLRRGIPCPECSGHYNAWINGHPVEMTTVERHSRSGRSFPFARSVAVRTTSWPMFSHWLLDLHNAVNVRKGVATWDMQQLNAVYRDMPPADVRASMESLRGVVGVEAFSAIQSLLRAIGV